MRRGLFFRQLRTLIWKDLLVEARGRETVLAGAVFALLVLVIFNFAFDLRVENVAAVAPGVLWVTVTFAGVLSLGRAFALDFGDTHVGIVRVAFFDSQRARAR